MNKYWNMPLSELEREAYNTNNELALAILGLLDPEVEQVIYSEQIKTKYKEEE